MASLLFLLESFMFSVQANLLMNVPWSISLNTKEALCYTDVFNAYSYRGLLHDSGKKGPLWCLTFNLFHHWQEVLLHCGWLAVRRSSKGGWKCSMTEGGGPSVTTNGMRGTQRWCADSWGWGELLRRTLLGVTIYWGLDEGQCKLKMNHFKL